MDTNYDFQIRERADGQWGIVQASKHSPIALNATLEGALEQCSEMAPRGCVRVQKSNGKVGIIQLDGPSISSN